eukprot:TRINITY_DN17406_c0_g1_i1.p1 TRINITY_DN17406_c0_g1~~TRINITY_DN17406_c0_g1_i1.p1  ORF type:complete len:450 (+),score=181.89 TRINITY_DN17406_c0_g1_i1:78-1352(+)
MHSSAAASFAKVNESFYLFFSLPEEMSLNILSFLSAADMCSLARTNRDMRRFSLENMLWRKLCKKSGWTVARSVVHESQQSFDYRKYYAEKHSITKPGSLQWTEAAKTTGTVPTKRFKHTATVVGKHMIFIGGQETDTKRFNEIVYYDTETKTFSQPVIKGDKVPNFSRHTSCLVGSKIYVFGGFDGHGTNFELSVFDPFARIWTNVTRAQQKGAMPPSRTNHAAAAVGKNMYIFGGNNNNEAGQYQVLGDLSVLNTQTLTWTNAKCTGEVPCARSGHTLTAIGKKLYLFGGGVWNETEGWVHKFNDLHVLDTETMNWTKPQCSGTVDTSTFPISFSVGRFLFVFGGGSKPLHCVTNDLYILDTYTYTWATPQCDGSKPQPRDMGSASVVGDNVYFLVGYAGGAVDFFDRMTVSCSSLLSVPCV